MYLTLKKFVIYGAISQKGLNSHEGFAGWFPRKFIAMEAKEKKSQSNSDKEISRSRPAFFLNACLSPLLRLL